jgi:sarcosine/dimethylglycine N-methyltransferase
MRSGYSQVVETAREYYNSDDADNFYFRIWGGEDIHIGLYEYETESIFKAGRRTVERLASLAGQIGPDTKILDLGAGYGGAARFLAKEYGCHVTALNLSEVENERNRQMNREQGLDHLIEVMDASFEEVDKPDESYHIVWSQDAILHSEDRRKVMAEVKRLLKPQGRFVFTDIMQADDCPEGVLQPILDRIHLDSLGSLSFYRGTASELGLEDLGFEDHTPHLSRHYSRVLNETEKRRHELEGYVSPQYIERMKTGLRHWIEGGRKGWLQWGALRFGK